MKKLRKKGEEDRIFRETPLLTKNDKVSATCSILPRGRSTYHFRQSSIVQFGDVVLNSISERHDIWLHELGARFRGTLVLGRPIKSAVDKAVATNTVWSSVHAVARAPIAVLSGSARVTLRASVASHLNVPDARISRKSMLWKGCPPCPETAQHLFGPMPAQ
jgi:hypothetical protein